MKRAFKIMLILSLALAVLAIVSGIGIGTGTGTGTGFSIWNEASSHPGMSVSINGEDLDFQGFDGLYGLGVMLGLAISAVVLCVILPLLLLFSIGLPLLIIGVVMAAVVVSVMSVGALLFSPLIVIGVVLYLLLRTKKPRASRASIAP